jgi:putative ABC transport system permease protein
MVGTVVGSIRAVDWNRMQTNFFVFFPDSVLESAPQTWVTVSRSTNAEQSGRAQAAIVSEFPNVSAIDLTLIIEVLEGLFARLSAVIQFMALFSIITGLIILAGAVVVSRFRRIDEIVLLKTLGASRRDVRRINTAEYLSLGTLSAIVALALALPTGWVLARYAFVVPYEVPGAQLAVAVVAVALLTTAIGIINSRGIYDAPALRVLQEVG